MTLPNRRVRIRLALCCLVIFLGLTSQREFGFPVQWRHRIDAKTMIKEPGVGAARSKFPVALEQPGMLLEDGRDIGRHSPKIKEVQELGGGRFRAKKDNFYFSSSDGTNPKTNGRIYTFVYPPRPPLWVATLFGAAALALTATLLRLEKFRVLGDCWPASARRDPLAFGQDFIEQPEPHADTVCQLFASLLLTSITVFAAGNLLTRDALIFASSGRIGLACLGLILVFYTLSRLLRSIPGGLASTYLFILCLVFAQVSLRSLIFYGVSAASLAYTIATLRIPHRTWLPTMSMAAVAAATTTVIPKGYTSWDIVQRLHAGDVFLDTVFHASVAAMIKTYGVASSGLHGLVQMPYYVFSHGLMAGLSDFSHATVLEVYGSAPAMLFGPVLIFCVAAACKSLDVGNRIAVFHIWVWTSLMFACIPFLFGPWHISNSFLRSESYLIGLGLFLTALPVLFKRRLSCGDIALSALTSALIAGTKASVALMLGALWVTRALLRLLRGERDWRDSVVIGAVFATVLTQTSGMVATQSAGAFSTPFQYIRTSLAGDSLDALLSGRSFSAADICMSIFAIASFAGCHFILSWAVLAEAVHRGGVMALLRSPAAAYSLAALCSGLFLAFTVTLTHGAVYYFTSVAIFVSLPGTLAFLNGWRPKRALPEHWLAAFALVVILGISHPAYRAILQRSLAPPTAENTLVRSLVAAQNAAPQQIVFRASPEILALSPFSDCKARPFLFPAASERAWINVIEPDLECDLTDYGFEQYGVVGGRGPATVEPRLNASLKVEDFHLVPEPQTR